MFRSTPSARTFDTILGVYTGSSVSSLTTVASDDDSGGNYTSKVTFNAVPGRATRLQWTATTTGPARCPATSPCMSAWQRPSMMERPPQPGTTGTNRAVPTTPPVQSDASNRSVAIYNNVINQFAVGVNPRYQPSTNATYCNIFAWDVTRAMNAEIPHWYDTTTGSPTAVGVGNEMNRRPAC